MCSCEGCLRGDACLMKGVVDQQYDGMDWNIAEQKWVPHIAAANVPMETQLDRIETKLNSVLSIMEKIERVVNQTMTQVGPMVEMLEKSPIGKMFGLGGKK